MVEWSYSTRPGPTQLRDLHMQGSKALRTWSILYYHDAGKLASRFGVGDVQLLPSQAFLVIQTALMFGGNRVKIGIMVASNWAWGWERSQSSCTWISANSACVREISCVNDYIGYPMWC